MRRQVKVNANGRAETVEELRARRQTVALDVLRTVVAAGLVL